MGQSLNFGDIPRASASTGDDTSRLRFEDIQPAPAATEREPNTIGTFVTHAADQINPVTAAQAVVGAVAHPIDTVKHLGAAQGALFDKAKTSYDQGDYLTAARHFVDYLLPLIGPPLDAAADRTQRGDIAAGTGDAVGLGLAMFGPKALSNLAETRYPLANRQTPGAPDNASAAGTPANPVDANAVQFARDHDIPLDAATATGNRFVRGVQKLADESLGGSVIADKAQRAQANRLASVGDELADQAHPVPTTPEQAGMAVKEAISAKIADLHHAADTAYAKVRGTPATVDMTPVKKALAGLHDELTKRMPIAQQQASAGLKALENIVNGPDTLPLAEADANLSAVKAVARGADSPYLRNVSQGTAAFTISKLDAKIREAAKGAKVLDDLDAGRAATRAKYTAADVLASLRDEPVQTFRQATWAKDAGIDRLREVSKIAPETMPQIGRAYLDDLLQQATSQGGFDHATKIASDWQKLGSGTKMLLFKDPLYIKSLDNFFTLGKKIAENPNPSGTALTLWKGGELTALVASPLTGATYSLGMATLSKLLHSPVGVRLLTEGLRTPAKGIRAVQWSAKFGPVANAVRSAQAPAEQVRFPKAAEQSAPATR